MYSWYVFEVETWIVREKKITNKAEEQQISQKKWLNHEYRIRLKDLDMYMDLRNDTKSGVKLYMDMKIDTAKTLILELTFHSAGHQPRPPSPPSPPSSPHIHS